MRLLRLDLIRYGHLADVTLDFPRAARLHVVLGPNEAGKSTALSAIGDALFGFEHRTDFAFLFETSQLRLGFEVEAADGTRERFIRRKGNRNTLLDGAEQAVPEAALTRLLGGAKRDLFATTYGLNGETLRRGALALLASGGEAGESLLAGMGVQNLRGALDRLDEQAKALAGSRKHNQALTVALDGWKRAREAADEAAIRPREWVEAEAELQSVHAALQAARAEARALREEEARLRRARLVRPTLAQLDAWRAEHAALADAPDLPPDAAAALDRLRAALRGAEEDARREAAEAARLEERRAALPLDPAVLALQDEIDLLTGRHGAVAAAERDLPGVARRVAAYRAQVAEAAAGLGAEAPPEAVRDSVPPAAARQRAQRLVVRRAELATAAASAATSLEEAERRREAAASRLAATVPPPPAGPLRRAIAAARAEGKLDRELAEAERRLAEASRGAAAALAALPLWSGDAAALAAVALPLEPQEDAVAQRLAGAEAAMQAARDAMAKLDTDAAWLEGELAQLARGETVPTREVIAGARARRDGAWRLLRRMAEGAAPGPRGDLPDGPLPELFEALRDEADRLADARADDAGRVASYAEKAARLRWLAAQRDPVRAAAAAAEARLAEAGAAWAALWAPSGLPPGEPAAMAAWRRHRAEVLRLAALEAEAARRRDDLAARIAEACALIHALLPDAAAPSLAALLDRAEESCAAQEAAERAHGELAARVAREAATVEEARIRSGTAVAELDAFDTEWRAALSALGLDPAAAPEALEAALEAWTRIAEAAAAWRGDALRAEEMRRTIAAFEADTRSVLGRLGDAAEEPATLAVPRLARRLGAARDAAKDEASLARQVAERRAASDAAGGRRLAAGRDLAALQALAGAGDLPMLEEAIRRATRRAELGTRIAALAEELLRQGDGMDEARLRDEAALDPDAAGARLEEIEAGEPARAERLTGLGARQQEVESRLATMQAGRDAAIHAQEARMHLAVAQDAAERYARLHLARSLLQAGIERLRQQRQGPLLGAASAHFARLTAGRYLRLEADETEAGQVVLRALRADRTSCPMDKLSEGTRDQLYLALRIAAVETHAEGAEPLPFIADDLLATFDDRRAAAALELLTGLGERVQTILFTHHAHVAGLASRLPGVSLVTLPGSEPPAAALPAA
jgi:chromosome segregation protein